MAYHMGSALVFQLIAKWEELNEKEKLLDLDLDEWKTRVSNLGNSRGHPS